MKFYFELQFKILNRKIKDSGISPILCYILILTIFYFASVYLFAQTKFAKYIYGAVALSFVSILSKQKRNDFLKTAFPSITYIKLRIFENLIIISPFIFFLLSKQAFLTALILILLSAILFIFRINEFSSIYIPTPFGRKPFEFTIGFRKSFYIYILSYFLTFQAIGVQNFNLAIFSILLVGFTAFTHYFETENEYFVWSYNSTPHSFLITKIKTGLLQFSVLLVPIYICLIIFFPEQIGIATLLFLLACVYLISVILTKYSVYPNKVNIPEALILSISLFLPPMLIVIIPYFYIKSIKRLNQILENIKEYR